PAERGESASSRGSVFAAADDARPAGHPGRPAAANSTLGRADRPAEAASCAGCAHVIAQTGRANPLAGARRKLAGHHRDGLRVAGYPPAHLAVTRSGRGRAWSAERVAPTLTPALQGSRSVPGELTHFDDSGASRMVDVGGKADTARRAVASGRVRMLPATLTLIRDRSISKGDVLEVARLAGIMAAKQTAGLIPLCHPLPLTSVQLDFGFDGAYVLRITAMAEVVARTGVEMEALTAVSVAALTVYDMCKAADRGIVIELIRLEEKSGGKSGDFRRSD